MRDHRLLIATAMAGVLLAAAPAAAQRGGGAIYFEEVIVEEEPQETPAPSVTPAPSPAPKPVQPVRQATYYPGKDVLKPLPARLVSETLETFASDAAFRAYLRDLDRERRRREGWWGYAGRRATIQVAQLQDPDAQQDVPCATPEDCPEAGDENVVVSGARISKPKPITNVQEAGVDEGDVVKQIGRFLLVLQDGRIFVADTGTRQGELRLVDRMNVYRDKTSYAWYDEMLVEGDQILVTAYSYEEDASELSVFRLSPEGKLERRGVFLISSDDYYDSKNYATRMVGDQLVIYTPLDVSEMDGEDKDEFEWPLIRRWAPEEQRDAAIEAGQRLFDARTIYKPIQPTLEPKVHTISVCPLGPVAKGRDMRCRSTAIVGPQSREFYVTPTDAYLWVYPGYDEYDPTGWDGKCDDWSRRGEAEAHPAALVRMPLSGDEPSALLTRGFPSDQFSFDARKGRFRGLVRWAAIRCGVKSDEIRSDFKLLDVPLTALSYEPREASRSAYTPVPHVGEVVENRFTDHHLIYGGRSGWSSRPPEEDEKEPLAARAVAVPLRTPKNSVMLSVPHNVIRLEAAGPDAVMTGYRDHKGLSVSVVDLSAVPRLADTVVLDNRYESEGRSHAFNSAVEPDGHGLMGLPTVVRQDAAGRWWWNSDSSDVSFLSVTRDRKLASIGEIKADEDAVDDDYDCEVSCVDWYGNTRPIFTDGRVFGLTGTELVEGRVDNGRLVEIRRLNLSKPVGK